MILKATILYPQREIIWTDGVIYSYDSDENRMIPGEKTTEIRPNTWGDGLAWVVDGLVGRKEKLKKYKADMEKEKKEQAEKEQKEKEIAEKKKKEQEEEAEKAEQQERNATIAGAIIGGLGALLHR